MVPELEALLAEIPDIGQQRPSVTESASGAARAERLKKLGTHLSVVGLLTATERVANFVAMTKVVTMCDTSGSST